MSVNAWSSEQDLVETFASFLQLNAAKNSGRRLKIIREFDADVGRVDILCVWYNLSRFAARKSCMATGITTPFSRLGGYAMALLKQCRWMSLTTFEERLRISHAIAAKTVRLLTERNLALVDGNYIKARANDDIWLIDSIQAYEAKLSKWQVVIGQAAQHEWFVSQSSIVMPSPRPAVRRHLVQQCADKGIGVILYEDRDTAALAVEPVKRKPPMTHFGWSLNERIFEEECFGAQLRSFPPGCRLSVS